MAFSTVQFLFIFLPLFLAVYYLTPRRFRNWPLAACSLLFCAWGGARAAALLLGFAALNWLFGLALGSTRVTGRAKSLLLAGCVAADVALLGFFKYAGWLAAGVNALWPGALPVPAIALPLGISFYTFQGISYCVEVARGSCPPERSPLRFGLYLGFFGHVLSGPIVRYGQQAAALDPLGAARRVDAARFCYGIKRFILGLAKKAILADQIGLLYAKVTAAPAAGLPGGVLLLGYFAYALFLYFDFSGYSDMAIGLGELFGLPLPENFDYPYLARTVGEYWRRWHMTLSGWFRDYVYIPLGGSRCKTGRICLNLLVVFLLTGLWHGAAWQYAVFGLYHGLLLCAERLFLRKALARAPRWAGHVYTLAALLLGLVIFGAPGLSEGLAALRGILTWQAGAPGYTFAAFADAKTLLLLAVGALLAGPAQALLPRFRARLRTAAVPTLPGMAALLVLLFFSVMRLTAGSYTAFIYFQF